MIAAVSAYLSRLGYVINDKARTVIENCDDWYRVRTTRTHQRTTVNGAHYTMERMGFGKRAAADDANLCETLEINAGGGNDAQFEFVCALLKENCFAAQYRAQLEMTAAEGTVACYVTLEDGELMSDSTVRGGRIRLNYVDALGFIPLKVVNNEVIEAAFAGEDIVRGEKRTTLVVCRLNGRRRYEYEVRVFDRDGREIAGSAQRVELGEVKPFAVMRTAQVNSLDDMQGYGFPKLHDAIPILRGLDTAFTVLIGDIETAEKITLVNELLCGFDEDGKPIPPNAQMKRQFVTMGEKLPADKPLVHEIVPDIRIDKLTDTIELLLSLLSMQFGYGTKKYTFDRSTRSVTTATEYIGERQDMMQELNKQRAEAEAYICGIVRAMLWFANTYQGGSWNIDADVQVEFDDSYITNRAEQLESTRADVLSGIGGVHVRKLYLMQKYNLDEKEAARWAALEDSDAAEEVED